MESEDPNATQKEPHSPDDANNETKSHALENSGKSTYPDTNDINVELEKEKLALEREKLSIETDRRISELDLKKREIDTSIYREKQVKLQEIEAERYEIAIETARLKLAREKEELANFQKDAVFKRKTLTDIRKKRDRAQTWSGIFQGFISVVLLCLGVVFSLRGDNFGPYLMGAGATNAGVSLRATNPKNRKKEDSFSESEDEKET